MIVRPQHHKISPRSHKVEKRMQLLLFDGFNGLIQGAFYALLALGLSLIISLNSVINFAHGEFMVIGAYLAYALVPYLGFWGALVVGPLLTGVLGILVERGLIRFMYARSDPVYSLLLTFGLALIIENAVRSIWGPQGVPSTIPSWLGTPVSSTYFFVTGYRLFVMAAIALAAGALFVFLRYSNFGVRIRAGILDLETVSTLGVNVYMLRAVNFAIGILLAGFAGVLASGVLQLSPTMGNDVIMTTFVAIVVGGIGSLLGSVLGALLIGVAAGVTSAYYPVASDVVIYVIMAVVLVVRPARIARTSRAFRMSRRVSSTRQLDPTAYGTVVVPVDRRLYLPGDARCNLCARRHGVKPATWLHRLHVVRTGCLFRPWWIWHRPGADPSDQQHRACGCSRYGAWRRSRIHRRPADHASTRHLLCDDHGRDRPDFSTSSPSAGTASPAAKMGSPSRVSQFISARRHTPGHSMVLLFRAVLFRGRRGRLGLLLNAPLGHTWVAIRENRRRATFLGIHVERYVWASFAIAGLIARLAGSAQRPAK